MGFFDDLNKIAQGKPVFEPTDANLQAGQDGQVTQSREASPQPQTATPAPQGPKTIPVVQVRRVECRDNGPQMELQVDIQNDSREDVMLDKILLLGTVRELDTTLRPGQSRQFTVYKGNRTPDEPRGYAEVRYRKMDGDYFSAIHQLRGRKESDGYWDVVELRLQLPIKDLPA